MNNKKNMNNNIWFDRPATRWEEVTPIGNGSLGAMVWGTVKREHLGINQDTLWSGYYHDKNNCDAKAHLDETRQMVFEGRYYEAGKNVEKYLLGEFTENYMYMGDLWIEQEGMEDAMEAFDVNGEPINGNSSMEMKNYRRELNMNRAVATVSYECNGVKYTREYFASYPNRCLVIKYTSSDKHLSLKCSFESELQTKVTQTDTAHGIIIRGQCPEHVDPSYLQSENPIIWGDKGKKFEAHFNVQSTDGKVSFQDEKLTVTDASEIIFVLTAVDNPKIEANYDELLANHLLDYQQIFSKVDLFLGEHPDIPTYKRLEKMRDGDTDPAMYALFFQYGRYLLISSSREGSEAANLQGIWNWEMRAPWSANYTTNINVEMNYWLADSCNLFECMEPYIRLLEELVPEGQKTAQTHFGARGFCVGHNTDYWRNTNPVGVPYGKKEGVDGSSLYAYFMLSGQWMCQELWQHYEYTTDKTYLKEKVYPILREASLFTVDWLVEHEGVYVTCPSASPENEFFYTEGETENKASISMATTMDMTIVREVFENFKKACRELGIEDELLDEIKERESKLPPFKIGEDGRLLEWFKDFKEVEKGHRHISHVYGLFPGELFSRDEKLVEACRKTIETRLSQGGGHTGWSCAWIINLFDILEDSKNAYKYLRILLTRSTENNLWTNHPPFQIDANFAGTTAIANMLVQDRNGEIKILPALPKDWKNGYVKGLRIKGNRTIDISWNDGKLTEYETHEG